MSNQANTLPVAEEDTTPTTKSDVNAMITHRLNLFHDALVGRGQIKPMPEFPELGPKADAITEAA